MCEESALYFDVQRKLGPCLPERAAPALFLVLGSTSTFVGKLLPSAPTARRLLQFLCCVCSSRHLLRLLEDLRSASSLDAVENIRSNGELFEERHCNAVKVVSEASSITPSLAFEQDRENNDVLRHTLTRRANGTVRRIA